MLRLHIYFNRYTTNDQVRVLIRKKKLYLIEETEVETRNRAGDLGL